MALIDNSSEVSANARCNDGTGDLVALFFSEQLDDIARAKSFCSECPVKEACFEAALVRREPNGVWGGRLFFKGKVLATKRPKGRPPGKDKSNVVPIRQAIPDPDPPPTPPLDDEAIGLLFDLAVAMDLEGGKPVTPRRLNSLAAAGMTSRAEAYEARFGSVEVACRLVEEACG